MVRTRIAPSPTGYPHIGTIYQALFDFAYAKKNNGEFIIRIEDTDHERFVADAEEKIYAALDWFGLSENESTRKGGPYNPYRQSERLEIYQKYAQKLIEKGDAYYCFCTKERLDEIRKQMTAEKKVPMYDKYCRNLSKEELEKNLQEKKSYVVRMKVPKNEKILVKDEIRDVLEFDSNGIDDQVILKSDGFPTYHLAVVVDDFLMKITHVVRGEEWISSFPKHILLYKYLEIQPPLFFHTSVLRNPDKSKMSKRHSHTSVTWYQQEGFLPEAILNYMALLGWTNPQNKEVFSLEEFIHEFELKDMRAIGPIFDLVKLEWMNGEYIRKMDNEELAKRVGDFIGTDYPKYIIEKTIPLVKERIKKLSQYIPMTEFFFKTPHMYEVDLKNKIDLIKKIVNKLNEIENWTFEEIGNKMVETAKENDIKNSEFFMILRVAISGKKISPPLNESMEILGKEKTIEHLHHAIYSYDK